MLSVPAVITKTCIRPSTDALAMSPSAQNHNDTLVRALLHLVRDRQTLMLLDGLSSLATLTAVSHEFCSALDTNPAWLAIMGLSVDNAVPALFSFKLLAKHIYGFRNHQHLNRRILVGLESSPKPENIISESAAKGKLTPIIVHLTPADEKEYWLERFLSLLKTSSVPTLSQWKDVASAYVLVRQTQGDNMTAKSLVDLVVAEEGFNKVLAALVFALVADSTLSTSIMSHNTALNPDSASGEKKAINLSAEDVNDAAKSDSTDVSIGKVQESIKSSDAVERLLTDITSISHALGFLNGLTVEDLFVSIKSQAWKLNRKLRLPRIVRRALAHALANCSPMQLFDLNKNAGLWKSFIKSLKLYSIASKLEKQAQKNGDGEKSAKLQRLLLFLSCLRKEKYPSSEESYGNVEWRRRISEPLLKLCEGYSIIHVKDQRWLSRSYNKDLANSKLPFPLRNTVESILSRQGNNVASWNYIMDNGYATTSQIISNFRSLALIDYPADRVKAYLEMKSGKLPLSVIGKIGVFMRSGIFTDDMVASIVKRRDAPEPSAGSKGADGLVRMKFNMDFRDAKGQVSLQEKWKNVSRTFSCENTVSDYRNIGKYLLHQHLDSQQDNCQNIVAAITLTDELQYNCIRTGIPPIQPPYAPVSLWRGECLSLDQLCNNSEAYKSAQVDSANRKSLLAGITWLEHPKGHKNYSRVDLDLSIIVYDRAWNELQQCSYTKLDSPGMKHSGDITSAPHEEGGVREDVLIQLDKLKEGAKFIAIVCFNFTNQQMDVCCEDSSIFIADPSQKGSGPGGLSIICSASLKGRGRQILGGLVTLHDGDTPKADGIEVANGSYFMCCDQPILGKSAGNNNVETQKSAVAETAINVLRASALGKNPSKARLSLQATLAAATIAKVVLLEHKDGIESITRGDGERKSSFFERVLNVIKSFKPTSNPKYCYAPEMKAQGLHIKKLLVIGGELDLKRASSISHANRFNMEYLSLAIANLRSNQESVQKVILASDPEVSYLALNVNAVDVVESLKNTIMDF